MTTTTKQPTQETLRPPTVEERAGEFTRLYEARAYLIYNLTLRITCARKDAMAAAETAFLRQAEPGAGERTLLPAAVAVALADAKRDPKPDGVGEAERPLLAAAAGLAPPERAALALWVMADMPTDEVAALLGVGEGAAAELLERATAGFAASLGIEPGAVYDAYVEWGWAEPPAEVWERVYPSFRRALERPAAAAGAAPAAASAAKPPRARRGRRRLRIAAGSAAAVALLAAGLFAYAQRGGHTTKTDSLAAGPATPAAPASLAPVPATQETGDAPTPKDPVAAMQTRPHKPLTPRQLDELRLKELAMLRDYQKRQTDRSLTAEQRAYAAKKVGEFAALAQQRAAVARREKQVARQERQLAAERRRQQAADERRQRQDAHQPPPAQSPPQSTQPQNDQPSSGSGDGTTTDSQQQQCLQDTSTGKWICPSG